MLYPPCAELLLLPWKPDLPSRLVASRTPIGPILDIDVQAAAAYASAALLMRSYEMEGPGVRRLLFR